MTKDNNNNNNKHYYGSVSVAAPHTTQSNKNHVVLQEDEVTPLLTRTKINNQNDKQNKESLWSRLIFQWFDPILELGNKQQRLELHDLNLVSFPLDCQTKEIQSRFYYYWNLQLESARNTPTHTPSLLMALFQSFGRDFIMAGFLKLIHDLSLFVGPLVLNGLIYFLRDANAPLYQGLELTLTVTVSQVLMSFCLRHYFFHCYLTGLRIRSACVLAVYQKALRLHAAERQTRSTGEINNLLSIDAQRMQELTNYLHAIWYSFLQIGLALLFLWKQLGPSSLGGVAVICITIPITKYVAQWLGNIQKHLLKAKDQRVQLNAEVMTSIKIIKLQAWEEPFQQRLMTLRNNELQQLWNYIVAQAVSVLLWSTTPLAVALATFSAYILAGHKLEVASALVALALLDILRFPLFMLPQIVNRIVEANVSLHRIQSFLQSNEHYPHSHHQHDDDNNRISMDQATFAHESRKPRLPGVDPDATTQELMDKQWEIQLLKAQLQEAERNIRHLEHVESTVEQQQQPIMQDETNLLCLKRINFHCQRGEFIAVVGGVGCGKSSFLNAILGEIRQLSGTTFVNGTLSLFSQTPFILNDTVKNNILFGHTNEPVNEELYQKCLSACALRHDLKLLPAGDATEIGEKGITLSGGQKARVALARVMYHNADLVLLDDPLAAVDAHVGKHLFHKCIVKELLQGGRDDGAIKRTVILVTNALQYLNNPMIDRILVFQNGRIVEEGSFEELSQGRDTLLSKFLAVMAETGVSPTVTQGCDTESMPGLSISGGEFSVNDEDTISLDDEDVNDEPAKKETSGALMTDEFKERVQGHVDKQVYIAWGRAAGGIWVPIVILLGYGLAEGINVLSKWFLTYWSHHGEEGHQIRFLGIYALINLSVVLTTCFRNMILMSCGLRASRVLFARLLSVVLQAPTSFFDTTPLGRIINRFSKDMNTVDQELVQTLRSYLMTLFSVFSTIVVISTITPIFTLCLIPILVFYAIQQAYFTVSYRELKRLDSVARSPIFALLGETLDGVATIRAFGAQGTLSERLNAMLDRQQHAFYLINAAQCWLAIRLELAGTLIITFACLSSVLQHGRRGGDEVFAGLAGLAISYALSVTQSLNWSVRMASDFEANMVAVERIEQYSSIPSEAQRFTATDSLVPGGWPDQGAIQFIGAKLRYRPELPLVLRGLDFSIPPGSKVGVVGRTGAGKSTLMVALLRIVELCEGRIMIDGVDHQSLGLSKLRSKIAVIPQDPVLFSGSIRSNLDPFNEYSDETLLDVLARVGLYSSSSSSSGNQSSSTSSLTSLVGQIQDLTDVVQDGGSNYSVGQRQLLVIARALLRGSSIVIMDEATAAVDADTDARIQRVLRNDFVNATCLTVAHRINTIIDSDYILVMSDGRAVEFDTPRALINRGGLFADLVEASGRE